MAKSGAYRGLTAIAMLRLSEREIRSLHDLISETNGTVFLEIIRGMEDEIETSLSLVLERTIEQPFFSSTFDDFYQELNRLRKRELRMTVHEFAGALSESIFKNIAGKPSEVPAFDSRRGLQAWLKKLVQCFSESEVYHATMRMSQDRKRGKGSDWKIR